MKPTHLFATSAAAAVAFLLPACAGKDPRRVTSIQSTTIHIAPAPSPFPRPAPARKPSPPSAPDAAPQPTPPPVAPAAASTPIKPPAPEITETVETETTTVLETTTVPVSDQDLGR